MYVKPTNIKHVLVEGTLSKPYRTFQAVSEAVL